MTGTNDTLTRRIGPFKLALIVAGLAVAIFLSVVASRTSLIAIVDTGDGGPVAIAALALLDSNGVTPVTAGPGDNYAVAINTEDGTTLAETAFLITYAASGVVDQTNAAVAYSSCELCKTFAFAVEVILVPAEKADIVTPTNLAAAVNEDCLSCETGAFATQIVLGVDGPVGFTEEGNEELEQIQEDLAQLAEDAENLTLEEIQARYDEIIARLKEVLATELVPIGNSDQHKQEERESTTLENTTLEETTSEPAEKTEATGPESTEPTNESTSPERTAPERTAPEKTAPERTTPETTAPTNQPTTAAPAPEESAPAANGTPVPGESTTAP